MGHIKIEVTHGEDSGWTAEYHFSDEATERLPEAFNDMVRTARKVVGKLTKEPESLAVTRRIGFDVGSGQ